MKKAKRKTRLERLESDGWVVTRVRTVDGWVIRAEKNNAGYTYVKFGTSISHLHKEIYGY